MTEKILTLQWNQLVLDAIKYSCTSPPLAARALAMVHTAMYDAWSVYEDCPVSTGTALYVKIKEAQHCTKDNQHKAFSYAAFRVLTELFWLGLPPQHKNMFRQFMCRLGYDPDDTCINHTSPQGIGNLAAAIVIEYRAGDESNPHATLQAPAWADFSGYTPVNTWDKMNDPDHWQPLRIEAENGKYKVQQFLVPHWALVRPFALLHNWQFRPEPPYRKHLAQFKSQAKEIVDTSANLNDKQKAIAEYWADGAGTYSIAGHWCEIAQFMAEAKRYGNSNCIKLFFALGSALLDVSIACWECKRSYDSGRPISIIRELYKGKDIAAWGGPHRGMQTIKGEQWQSYIPTPPFAEHVSLHSAVSYAAATILKNFTGSDEFGGCSVIERNCSTRENGTTPKHDVTLEWATFTEAAAQAAQAGIYGGIHFAKANKDGQTLGENIGKQVWEKAVFYFNS